MIDLGINRLNKKILAIFHTLLNDLPTLLHAFHKLILKTYEVLNPVNLRVYKD